MPTRLALFAALVVAAFAAAAPAHAAVTPVSTETSLRSDLGGVDNGDAVGSAGGGFRQTDFSEVPDALTAPALLPGDFYDVQHPRGLVLTTPGSGVAVSAADRTMAPVDSTITDVAFRVPGTDTPAVVGGFGAVFTQGDGHSTALQFFGADGSSLGTVIAPSGAASFAGGEGTGIARVRITSGTAAVQELTWGEPREPLAVYTLSEGAYAAHEDDGALVVTVRRTGALGAGSVHVATAAGTATDGQDFTPVDATLAFAAGQTERTVSVPLLTDRAGREGDETFTLALDDPQNGVLGDPARATVTLHDDPPPPARPDRTRPRVALAGVRHTMPRSRFLRGVRFAVATNEAASLQVTLLGSARRAVISRVYDLTLGRRTFARARGTRTVRVRPSRRLVGSARRFTVRLRVLAIDRGGNRRAVTRRIRVVG